MKDIFPPLYAAIAALVGGGILVSGPDVEQVRSDTAAAAAYASTVKAEAKEPTPAVPETKPAPAKPVAHAVAVLVSKKETCQCQDCQCRDKRYKVGDKLTNQSGDWEVKWVKVSPAVTANPDPRPQPRFQSRMDCSTGTCRPRW